MRVIMFQQDGYCFSPDIDGGNDMAAKQITKDMLVTDVLKVDDDIASILIQNGMGCIFCPASQMESVEAACFVHGIDPQDIVDQVNEYLQDKYEAEA